MEENDQARADTGDVPFEPEAGSTDRVSQSGGVNLSATDVNVGQDVVGRDKIIQNIYIQLGLPEDQPPQSPLHLSSSQKHRLQQRKDELQAPLNIYDQRVQALTNDIAIALDGEQRTVLQKRLDQVKRARKEIEIELEEIERLLAAN